MRLRSIDMDSGMVRIRRYPRLAATKASAIPVLPEVGSTSVPPGFSFPVASSCRIMFRPIRSFTLASGLKNSHLKRRVAFTPSDSANFGAATSGVAPTVSRMDA